MTLFDNLPEQAAPPPDRIMEPQRQRYEKWDALKGRWTTAETWIHPDFPRWHFNSAEDGRRLIAKMRNNR